MRLPKHSTYRIRNLKKLFHLLWRDAADPPHAFRYEWRNRRNQHFVKGGSLTCLFSVCEAMDEHPEKFFSEYYAFFTVGRKWDGTIDYVSGITVWRWTDKKAVEVEA